MSAREPCTTLRRVADSPCSSTTGGPSPAHSPSSVMLPAPGSWRRTWNLVVSTALHCDKEFPPYARTSRSYGASRHMASDAGLLRLGRGGGSALRGASGG